MLGKSKAKSTARGKSKAPTMHDVANAAQVSIATVSAFINGTSKVSPKLTRRIENAISVIGYEPNAVARSLKTGMTHTIGVVVTDICNPFFSDMVSSVQHALNRAGYAAMVCSNDENPKLQGEQVKLLIDRAVEGLIIAPAGGDGQLKDLLSTVRKPVVLIDRTCKGLDADTVTLNNRQAAEEAISYLLGLGHQRVGYISGSLDTSTGRDRLDGYRQALEEAGLPYRADLVREGNFNEADGYRAAMQLLARPDRPSAIFSANNLMTIGTMKAIRDLKLSCPEDVSVACLDDFPWADVFHPRLTTVAQPVQALGEHAVNLMLARLANTDAKVSENIVLKGNLTIRESCRPITSREAAPLHDR